MAYTKYSLTPANNNAAPPDGAPEGMLPSAVNDTMRDMMAQIRDCGDGIRGGTYTMTAPVITGGSITGITSLSTTGNTVLGDATTDTLNVGNGGIVKDASGNVGIGILTPGFKLHVNNASTIATYGAFGNNNNGAVIGVNSSGEPVFSGYASNVAVFGNYNGGSTFVETMRIDSRGNVGIGNIPNSGWLSNEALELGANSSLSGGYLSNLSNGGFLAITQNLVNTASSTYKYATSNYGSLFFTQSGAFYWQTAPSGTAGATATLTQRMSLSNTGDLSITGKLLNASSRPMVSQTGGVLQTVSFVSSAAFSTTGSSDVATGLKVTITPATTSSTVLITIIADARATATSGNCYVNPTLYRNSTGILNCFAQMGNFSSTDIRGVVAFTYLDSPGTTSPVTYELYMNSNFASAVYINNGAGNSMITAQEIAG